MRKIIIDTDAGIDDAIAIMIALAHQNEIEIKGITTLTGNTYVDQVTKNVLRILDYFKREDIKVYKGASKPLVHIFERGAKIHGKDGLGEVDLKYSLRKEEDIPAPIAIYEIAKEEGGIDLITLGPLTNISIALNLFPDLKNYINQIYSMGGAIERGNVTRFAEFNYFVDPEAAQSLIESKIKMTIIPWDPIIKNVFLEEELKNVVDIKTHAGKLFFSLINYPVSYFERNIGIRGMSLPDPVAMATYIDDKVIKMKRKSNIQMELNYTSLRGASVVLEGDEIEIVTEFNKENFLKILEKINSLKGGERL
ncbi:MAG: nucleoside hydrolase [Caldisericia bacterium]|nr:nucleoside hydrolase [Caldisericia bacterium]